MSSIESPRMSVIRHGPDVSRLLAALQRIADFDPGTHGSYGPSGQIALHAKAVARAAIAEHEAAQKGAGG